MDSLGMRRLPTTWVWQRTAGAESAVNWGRAPICALAVRDMAGVSRSNPQLVKNEARATNRREVSIAETMRLKRVRTGWVEHFRELALTRIPVKMTTPSLLLDLVPCAYRGPRRVLFARWDDYEGNLDYRRRAPPVATPFDPLTEALRDELHALWTNIALKR
jgi:hypothetical protein